MVRHSTLTRVFKLFIAMLAALVFVGIGSVTVSAGAHDCGCQPDNSGPGSSGPDNSGPGNACHDNSGPGSTTSGSDNSGSGSSGSDNSGSDNSGSGSSGPDNSGPGNAEDDCPVDDGDDGDNGGNSPGTAPSSNSGGSAAPSASGGTVVAGAQAPVGTTEAVPTTVAAGVAGEEDSGSTLGGLLILLGIATMFVALVHRRSRA